MNLVHLNLKFYNVKFHGYDWSRNRFDCWPDFNFLLPKHFSDVYLPEDENTNQLAYGYMKHSRYSSW